MPVVTVSAVTLRRNALDGNSQWPHSETDGLKGSKRYRKTQKAFGRRDSSEILPLKRNRADATRLVTGQLNAERTRGVLSSDSEAKGLDREKEREGETAGRREGVGEMGIVAR